MMEDDEEKFSHLNVVDSLESIAAVQVAVYLCNHPELKLEILCAPGLGYMTKKCTHYERKAVWNRIVKRKAAVLLENIGLTKPVRGRVISIVLAIGMRMLTWAKYHGGILNLNICEFIINFLNSSFFTQQGIIDNKKAAEELIKDENLNIIQKYKLACLYCFTDCIPGFFDQLTEEDKENLIKPGCMRQPGLVRFWTFYLMGEIDKLKGDKSLWEYGLEIAAEDGSKAAVEYCLEMINLSKKKEAIIYAAVNVVEQRKELEIYRSFNDQRYNMLKFLVPSNYYADVLCFLLSKLGKDEKKELLKRNIQVCERPDYCAIFECFLNWPYDNYFLMIANLMRECLWDEDYALCEDDYVNLLLKICDKIRPCEFSNLKYGAEKINDYKRLLIQFWHESPEHFKRYVLKYSINLFTEIRKLKNFTCKDWEIIQLILASATDRENENIISSREGYNICISLLNEGNFELLDRFVLNCFSSRMQADEFKRVFSLSEEVQHIFIDFVSCSKFDLAESFLGWSALPEELKEQLKRDILAKGVEHACLCLISCNRVESVDKFARWCFPTEGEVRAFKKELIFSNSGLFKCAELVIENRIELVDEFILSCLPSEEEITELKRKVGYTTSSSVLENLISAYSEKVYEEYDGEEYFENLLNIFRGGKWEEVEQYMTWCFPSEQEICAFKKSFLRAALGPTVHFNLIKCSKWNEAETFFAWLGLSPEEVKELKKETLFHLDPAIKMFVKLLCRDEKLEFADFGSKEEAVGLLLRWYLPDKETVLEFKDKFKSKLGNKKTAVLEMFDLMINQHLSELDEEKKGVKRKSEISSSSKRICNL